MSGPVHANANEPLYIDLDGTLISTDTLWESVCLLVRRHPGQIWALPWWAAQGKAVLKSRIASLVCPDPKLLPYRSEVLELIAREKASGRRLVLATASHERIAGAVALELGLFDGVLATTDRHNLRGAAKLHAITEDAAGTRFGYLGDSWADLPVWSGSNRALVVNPSPRLAASLDRLGVPTERVSPRGSREGHYSLLRALRPHQWVKNALLFAPLALAHQLTNAPRLWAVVAGFMAFCLVASAGYLINDMLDIEADRRHATKKRRPFAAGTVSIPMGLLTTLLLLAIGFSIARLFVPGAFVLMLTAYLLVSLSYSLYLKERLFLDVLVLAGLYTHRVLSGGVAGDIEVSSWLLAFSVFFFLSLALVKRYVELLQNSEARSKGEGIARRAYQVNDTGLVETMGITSGYLSVLVLGLYVSRADVTQYYAKPEALWLVTPLMLYWISRVWLLARRGELASDPVIFAATDRVSYAIALGVISIGVVAL